MTGKTPRRAARAGTTTKRPPASKARPGARRGGDSDAERRILEAAERLLARDGYNGVSIRDIAAAARANISSVYYHFGSKQALLEAVCRHRLLPAVAARAAAMAAARDGFAAVAGFVGPTLLAALGPSRDAALYRQLAGHLATDPTPAVRRTIRHLYGDSVAAFVAALQDLYPRAEPQAFFWGVVCALGAAVYVQGDYEHLKQTLGAKPGVAEGEAAIAHVTRFILGGLAALAEPPR